jgi:hypothetical protein
MKCDLRREMKCEMERGDGLGATTNWPEAYGNSLRSSTTDSVPARRPRLGRKPKLANKPGNGRVLAIRGSLYLFDHTLPDKFRLPTVCV